MPVLLGNRIVNTVGDVNNRIRSLMNDDNAQLYPDNSTQLLNAVRDAYAWMYGQVMKMQASTFEKVVIDLPYTPATGGEEQDLSAILPIDLYIPILLEFRLTTQETYQVIDRKTKLPSRNTEQLQKPPEWEWRGQTIFVNSGNQNGFIKLTYRSLVPSISLTTDSLAIANTLEAMAHYAASELARRRGQWQLMQSLIGDDGMRNGGIGTGAKFFASLALDHIIMEEQEIPSRGARFGEAAVDNISNRQYSG
jgi:hypothetical protein